MALVMTSPPGVEPVSLADAKAHMRISGDAEDVLIASLTLTARLQIEAALSLALVTQSWTMLLDRWPVSASVEISLRPLQQITDVRVFDWNGAATVVPDTRYLVDTASQTPRLVWKDAIPPAPGLPVNGIEIDLTAGFGSGADSVPAPLKHAILMLAAHWYEHRDPGDIGSDDARIPAAVSELIQPFRKIRL